MNDYVNEKKYQPFKIPDRRNVQESGASNIRTQNSKYSQMSLSDGLFYEIEYDNSPFPGVGKFVLKAQNIVQQIVQPQKDPIRELFYRMRDIARQYPVPYSNYNKFYDRRIQKWNARVFYKQAQFMKDFEDDYPGSVPFSSYYPYYQMLSYEQLRTYFTWRSKVRKGDVHSTSMSYVFLYTYELLNNIGVESPKDGLDRLMALWASYRTYEPSIDKYFARWIKDYHIYYELPHTFKEFVEENNLSGYYPDIYTGSSFDLFCTISKYDIRKSGFYSEGNSKLVKDCFYFVLDRIRTEFEKAGFHFYDDLFNPSKRPVPWTPFKDALFYNWLRQPDRKVVISENEIYICRNNEWEFSNVIASAEGRQLLGYIMKQMESVLRQIKKYKYKISASLDMIDQATRLKLQKSGLFIDNIVKTAVMEFYREATKTVVTVNPASLERIRQESLAIQEALIVDEEEENNEAFSLEHFSTGDAHSDSLDTIHYGSEHLDAGCTGTVDSDMEDSCLERSGMEHSGMNGSYVEQSVSKEPIQAADVWESLRSALSGFELKALAIILQNDGDMYQRLKEYADSQNIMLEVLADGINERAMDHIGDSILDEDFNIYEDYEEQVKGMVGL